MTQRSTRNKIRHHAKQAIDGMDKVMKSLQMLDEVAEKKSPFINDNMEALVLGADAYKKLLTAFRDML